jgi:hypothetical protein
MLGVAGSTSSPLSRGIAGIAIVVSEVFSFSELSVSSRVLSARNLGSRLEESLKSLLCLGE